MMAVKDKKTIVVGAATISVNRDTPKVTQRRSGITFDPKSVGVEKR